MTAFAHRLKKLREEKKEKNSIWTQGYVAGKIGVARTTYTAYENGTKQPPLDTVNSIATLLDTNTDYLLGRTNNPSPVDKDEEEFQAFINDPDLKRWHRELPKSKEEDLRKLRKMWEIMNSKKD
ncbi:helix-turn-helix domain-containing protein [Lederbergia lenta]|uniref:helix-turn-helix domain-containing protein n=1 Tax=Lederbergia lenta TaxID=1467 RepID=UPI00203E60BD|nr:helix-turn-helix transcriptional regulator [Lederbergia lenta]MCM3111644.1 helix-turn-helix transcriptional regulator [Lederbergia lenta]